MKYIFLILVTYCNAEFSTSENAETLESSGLAEDWKDGKTDQSENDLERFNPVGNNTFQNDFDGVIPVVFASEKEKKFKIKKFIIKIDPSDPLYKKIKLIRLVFILSFQLSFRFCPRMSCRAVRMRTAMVQSTAPGTLRTALKASK